MVAAPVDVHFPPALGVGPVGEKALRIDTITIFNRDNPAYLGYLQLTFAEWLPGPLSTPGVDQLVLGST